MPPLLANLKTLTAYSLAWSVFGVVGAQVLIEFGYATAPGALLWALPLSLLLGFILTSAYYVCRSIPLGQREAYQIIPIYLSAPIFSALIWLLACESWKSIIQNLELPWAVIETPFGLWMSLFIMAALFYFISLLTHDMIFVFANLRDAERRQGAAQLLAREAELNVLRSQINPHFLFNSLNSISALTTIDPVAARNMTIELGDFFRQTLTLSDQTKITLAEELQLCEHYLAIEKIRFGQKLQVDIERDPECASAKVIPMLLQPLIENAIKHGISHLTEQGLITIKCFVRAPWLHISMTNPIDGSCSNSLSGTGTGLKNIEARLRNVYGDQSRIDWRTNQHSFIVDMVIPLEYS